MISDNLLRKLPNFIGKQRLAKCLFATQIKNLHDILITSKYNCKFVLPNIAENIGFEVFINGVYEESAIEFIITKVAANGYIIDIGANIGTVVFPVLKCREDDNAMYIEASPRVFKYLQINQQKNNLRVIVY